MALYAEGKDEFWKSRQEAFTKRKKGTANREGRRPIRTEYKVIHPHIRGKHPEGSVHCAPLFVCRITFLFYFSSRSSVILFFEGKVLVLINICFLLLFPVSHPTTRTHHIKCRYHFRILVSTPTTTTNQTVVNRLWLSDLCLGRPVLATTPNNRVLRIWPRRPLRRTGARRRISSLAARRVSVVDWLIDWYSVFDLLCAFVSWWATGHAMDFCQDNLQVASPFLYLSFIFFILRWKRWSPLTDCTNKNDSHSHKSRWNTPLNLYTDLLSY